MTFNQDQYSVDYLEIEQKFLLKGVLRLPTPSAFDVVFAPLAARIARGEPLRVDLSSVTFMNSSGIRALASLVMKAKTLGAQMDLTGCAAVPWQKKTLASLAAISPELKVHIK
jgi:hypothetical protein